MRHFYKVASFVIDSEFKEDDFRLNRRKWFRSTTDDPVFFSVTSHDHGDLTYHADVNVYRRKINDELFDEVVA